MKIGFISMPLTGHINPIVALARKLKSRGHEMVFIGIPDVGPYARAAGLDFVSLGEEELPAGSSVAVVAPAAKLHGPEVTRWTIEGAGRALFQVASQHLPRITAETGVDALLMNTIHMYLEVVPMSLASPMPMYGPFYTSTFLVLRFLPSFQGATTLPQRRTHAT